MGKYLGHVFFILTHRFFSFAAYSASKAALNQAMRHMAAELKRKDDDTILLAIHPGEVATYVHLLGERDETDADDTRQRYGKYRSWLGSRRYHDTTRISIGDDQSHRE